MWAHRHVRGDGHVSTDTGTTVTLPQAEEHQGSAAATRAAAGETRDGSAFEPQGADPADTLISDFSPPEL